MRYRVQKKTLLTIIKVIDFFGYRLSFRHRKPPTVVSRILVLKLLHIGDTLAMYPVLYHLKKIYPQATIDIAVRPSCLPLFLGCDLVQNRWGIPPLEGPRQDANLTFRKALSWIFVLRQQRYDIILELRGDIRLAFFCACLGARYRVGLDDGGGGFLFDRLGNSDPEISFLDRDLSLIQSLKPDYTTTLNTKSVSYPIPAKDQAVIDRYLQKNHWTSFAVVHPGAGREEKNLTPEESLALFLSHSPTPPPMVFITGTKDQLPLLRLTLSAFYKTSPTAILMTFKKINRLAALLNRAEYICSADAGPMHLAGFLHRPVYAKFKLENPRIWFPYPIQA